MIPAEHRTCQPPLDLNCQRITSEEKNKWEKSAKVLNSFCLDAEPAPPFWPAVNALDSRSQNTELLEQRRKMRKAKEEGKRGSVFLSAHKVSEA